MRSAFVILSADEGSLLEHSLPAALAAGFDDGLVLDNASRDATAAIAERHGVPRLCLSERVPYAVAMNRALSSVDADAVALLTGDTFVGPGYGAACLAALSDASVGAVAPKLVRTLGPGPGERLGVLDAAGMSLDRRRKNGLVGHGAPASSYGLAGEAFGPDGAAAFWRTAALRDCAVEDAVFDEGIGHWATDADLAWRARVLGWRTAYAPDAIVHHIRRYSPTTRSGMPDEDRRTQFRNRLLMMVKNDRWRDVLRDAPLILGYEGLALGYAVLREPELLAGYREAWGLLPEARRQRRLIQARRRVGRVPFGLTPPR